MRITNSEEWREFYKQPGAIAVCQNTTWLLDGCPKCGGKLWEVTADSWTYCESCNKGYPTAYPFTSKTIELLDEDGLHCAFCGGSGCVECKGRDFMAEDE